MLRSIFGREVETGTGGLLFCFAVKLLFTLNGIGEDVNVWERNAEEHIWTRGRDRNRGWGNLGNKELRNLCFSLCIIRMIKPVSPLSNA
jgi:hypothetical protein